MLKGDSTFNTLVVAVLLAVAIGYFVPTTFATRISSAITEQTKPAAASVQPKQEWLASAPGRIEPAGGEVRIGAQAPGRIAEVLVAMNDKVMPGDLLVRLDDDELLAKKAAAEADVAVRKRDRDNETVGKAAQDRRTAEDAVANAENLLGTNRAEFDRVMRTWRGGSGQEADVKKARDAVTSAQDQLDQARASLRKLIATTNPPGQTRAEAALAASRAELSLACAALERTRIRASAEGTVLQVLAKPGETATPSPETPLVITGNLASLRARAEIEERDVGKLKVGLPVVVRSDAFPNRDFEGKIASLAQSLGGSKLGQRGPRKPTDVDVLEVLVDLPGSLPLLPGMRVDVFFKAEPAPKAASAKAG